ncbi:MAG TPA: EF-Tu/IF-2/RF-3 family GTPase, partial [Candidatus Paceibacterota bacterium]|nr:EF-Tu/IF-2/RF-3 family GTPase [Candidatus Paceibacterota bacterium]
FFSRTKDRQIVGGKVLSGEIKSGSHIKVIRNGKEIERGVVRGLEQAKAKTDEVKEGFEFGTNIEAKIDLAPGDMIESVMMVEK